MKNVEEITIENVGIVEVGLISMKIPTGAINVKVYDDLGEILGVSLIESDEDVSTKDVFIQLYQNRVSLTPTSKFKFFLEYYLPSEGYASFNWLQQSISIDLLTTKYEYLIYEQKINVIIEGCGRIDYMSSLPEALHNSGNSKVLVFNIENVSPLVKKDVLLTFTIDLFELLFRPVAFVMIIALLSSIFVLAIKTLKREELVSIFKNDFIPISEIREFCSLYEERNALVLEIRKAESETKRKKLAKKTYKNLLSKNTAKIDQIKDEILPFKKILMETNNTFSNIVKRLDVIDAERTSISDSLNLLEARYKRGKLPSKAAYQKLSGDFFNRQKKLDRTIDKYIQQLRSYIL
jgi:DNA-binding transcriptional MerR regulator